MPTASRKSSAPTRAPARATAAVVTDWRPMNSALFEALQVERVAMFVVLSIIVLVAAFNILSSLIMLVRAKTRDIAILRTMGATRPGPDEDVHDRRPHRSACSASSPAWRSASSSCIFRQPVVMFVQWSPAQNLWDPQSAS